MKPTLDHKQADNLPHVPSQIIHQRAKVRKELGISPVTEWRWRNAGILPLPDIEINGREYYSEERRQEVFDAVLSNKRGAA